MKLPKSTLIIILATGLVIAGFLFIKHRSTNSSSSNQVPTKAPPAPVNLIPISQRPYVTLKPLSSRNDLQLTIQNLIKDAKSVEVALEYDRNKGVMDAVLKQFTFTSFPFQDKLFLGSKSAGGHITYHDDVVGGSLTLTFEGGSERYALKVPWRYLDTASKYSELSTQDGKFQVQFTTPWQTPKYVVMQSPGLPANISGSVLAGPYLFRGVGELPQTTLNLTIRLPEAAASARLYGWDGSAYQPLDSKLANKTLTATVQSFETYLVTD